MTNCKTCGVEITQTEGKRERMYCSSSCKQKGWKEKKMFATKNLVETLPRQVSYEIAVNKLTTPEYKEGGLYRFEKGGFVEIPINSKEYVFDLTPTILPDTVFDKQNLVAHLPPEVYRDTDTGVPTLDLQDADTNKIFAKENIEESLTKEVYYETEPPYKIQPSPEPTTAPTLADKPKVEVTATKKEKAKESPKNRVHDKPERLKGESGVDYAIRISEWRENGK